MRVLFDLGRFGQSTKRLNLSLNSEMNRWRGRNALQNQSTTLFLLLVWPFLFSG
jgi:hypothetical protein